MKRITRREMLRLVAGGIGMMVGSRSSPLQGAPVAARLARLGIGMHSYGFQWRAAREGRSGAKFHDAITFLDYARELGAAGVQVAIGDKDRAYARTIKSKAEKHALYFEAQFQLPKDRADLPRFERDARLARDAGADVFRTACLSGRRYETFKSAEEFREFKTRSWNSLVLAEPVLKRQRLRLAVENHKDWLVPELLDILRRISSEWVGVCVDTGNSIALMEDAMDVIEAYAPFVFSVHLKDMGFGHCADGFLLSEVPLGDGFLPMPKVIAALRKANPSVCFNLEMITRDPLRVPCLTDSYWATMQHTAATGLARTLALAREHASEKPLPQTSHLDRAGQLKFEDDNVRASLAFARARLNL